LDVVEAVDVYELGTQCGCREYDQRDERCEYIFHQDISLFLVCCWARETLMARSEAAAAKTTLTRFISCDEVFRAQPPGYARVEDGQEDVRTPGL
jgi:hypothetical protein